MIVVIISSLVKPKCDNGCVAQTDVSICESRHTLPLAPYPHNRSQENQRSSQNVDKSIYISDIIPSFLLSGAKTSPSALHASALLTAGLTQQR